MSTDASTHAPALNARPLTSAPPTTLSAVSLSVTSVSGQAVGVSFNGLNGNNPGSYGNFISIFQTTSEDFPFGTTNKPIATYNVTGNVSGSAVIPANILLNTAYVVGYSTGAQLSTPAQPYGNVCATAYIPPTGSNFPTAGSSIVLNDLQANSIACSYNLPDGLTPQANGAWAGLWVGNNPSFTIAPTSYAQINSNMAKGGPLIFNNVQISRGTLFSIALFTSGWVNGGTGSAQTSMAASIQFSS